MPRRRALPVLVVTPRGSASRARTWSTSRQMEKVAGTRGGQPRAEDAARRRSGSETQFARAAAAEQRSTRSRISPAALFVNVIARISLGHAARAIRCATRWVSTRVLPEPAPATMSSGPCRAGTASRCGLVQVGEVALGGRDARWPSYRRAPERRLPADGELDVRRRLRARRDAPHVRPPRQRLVRRPAVEGAGGCRHMRSRGGVARLDQRPALRRLLRRGGRLRSPAVGTRRRRRERRRAVGHDRDRGRSSSGTVSSKKTFAGPTASAVAGRAITATATAAAASFAHLSFLVDCADPLRDDATRSARESWRGGTRRSGSQPSPLRAAYPPGSGKRLPGERGQHLRGHPDGCHRVARRVAVASVGPAHPTEEAERGRRRLLSRCEERLDRPRGGLGVGAAAAT